MASFWVSLSFFTSSDCNELNYHYLLLDHLIAFSMHNQAIPTTTLIIVQYLHHSHECFQLNCPNFAFPLTSYKNSSVYAHSACVVSKAEMTLYSSFKLQLGYISIQLSISLYKHRFLYAISMVIYMLWLPPDIHYEVSAEGKEIEIGKHPKHVFLISGSPASS